MATNLFFKSVVLSIFVVFLPSSIGKPLNSTAKPTTSSIGVCQLALKQGYCMGFFPRWYYNQKTKKCQQFIYGGCDGNSNNFLSKDACMLTCHATIGLQVSIPTSKPKVKTTSKESRKKIDIKPNTSQSIVTPPPQNLTKRAIKPCEIEMNKAMDSNQSGIFVPQCDGQGNYKTMQCGKLLGLEKSCWCVDKNGRKTGEPITTAQGGKTCDKTASANSPCIKALQQSLDASILLHGMPIPVNVFGHPHVPKCDLKTGLFTPRQCHKTKCWCVNIFTGAEIKRTYGLKDFVKCSDK